MSEQNAIFEDEHIVEIEKYARQNGIPVLLKDTAYYMSNLVSRLQPKKILEIGTAIGYSGTILLKSSNAHLTTIEKLPESYEIAKNNFKLFGLEDRVEMCLGDAKEILEKLEQDNRKFDFIFLDGPKGQYLRYLEHLKNMLEPNGIILSDNVYFHGLVRKEGFVARKKRTIVVNMRKFLETISTSPYESEILDIGDGISVTRIKGEDIC